LTTNPQSIALGAASDKTRTVTGPEKSLVREGYDRIASSYHEARPHDGEDIALLTEVANDLPNHSRVLDAGCGSGVPVARQLLEVGHDVTGLDFSSGQLSLARSNLAQCHLVQGDLTNLPFSNGSFDAVVSYYAIIHVPRAEHEALLSEIHRVLLHGGRALLCLGWGDLPEDRDPNSWLGVPMFWSHFDEQTNLALLSKVGLSPQWSKRVGDPMGHASHQFVLSIRR
jgi:SAM-dependent methyltransferase